MTERTHTSGNFTAVSRIINVDGDEWVDLQLTLTSGLVRLRVTNPMERRKTELKAESAALHLMGEELRRAIEEDEDAKG